MTDYTSLTRAELQAAAKAAGLKATGATKDILARLQAHTAMNNEPTFAVASSSVMDVVAAPLESDCGAPAASASPESAPAAPLPAAVQSKRKAETETEAIGKEDSAEQPQVQPPPAKKPKLASRRKRASSSPALAAGTGETPLDAPPPPDVDLTGKTFFVLGEFGSIGRSGIETLISGHGGVISKSVCQSLEYCVVGDHVTGLRQYTIASNLESCMKLNEKQLRRLLKDHTATMKRKASVVDPEIRVVLEEMRERLIPDLTSLIAEYASGSRGGWLWQEICTMLKCDEMPPPASESAIAKLEAELNVPLPECLKSLWRIADGMGKTSVHPWLHRFVDTTAGHSYIDAQPRFKSKHAILGPATTEAFRLFPSLGEIRTTRSCSLPFLTDGQVVAKNFWSSLDLLPLVRHPQSGEIVCIDRQSEMVLHLTPDVTRSDVIITIGILGSSLECILETYHRLVKAKYEALTDRDPTKTRDELEAEVWATSDDSPYRVTSAELRVGLDADRRRCGPRGHSCRAACTTHAGSFPKCAPDPVRARRLAAECTSRVRAHFEEAPYGQSLFAFWRGWANGPSMPDAIIGKDAVARSRYSHLEHARQTALRR